MSTAHEFWILLDLLMIVLLIVSWRFYRSVRKAHKIIAEKYGLSKIKSDQVQSTNNVINPMSHYKKNASKYI